MMLTLTEDELETIVEIAKRGMSGRVTAYEINELVRVYREAMNKVQVAVPKSEPNLLPSTVYP